MASNDEISRMAHPPLARGELSILIADDDAGIRDMLRRALSKDFRVHTAIDGTSALLHIETHRPAAIIVDEMMPGASGTEVLARAKLLYPDVPRILMTAGLQTAHAEAAINTGEIHRFYNKPLRLVELRQALFDLIERAREHETLVAELSALRRVREIAKSALAQQTRIIVAGAAGAARDVVFVACGSQNFRIDAVNDQHDYTRLAAGQPPDVLVLLVDESIHLTSFAHFAQALDETTAVVVLDLYANALNAVVALEAGAVDYVAPRPGETLDATKVARRLERAAARPRAQRDMRRLTFDLIVSNRELVASRKRVEADQFKLLNAMIRALEARDAYTAGHTDRVAEIAVRCGQVLGLGTEKLDNIRIGALLHDLGKIGVRDDVLLKPGRLTPEEFETIKTHTTIGANILAGIEQFACILPMVRNHHEKLDGTGYPDGLKGDAVIMEVRVVSASDVLDAITSTRPYRRGSSVEEAFDIMQHQIGRHLDENVFGALRALHGEGRLLDLLQQGAEAKEGPAPYREP